MQLYELKVFKAVAEERGFSAAAVRLSRTQPAVSLAIRRLEDKVGEKLLDRGGKELLLTDAGKVVLDYAKRFENLKTELDSRLEELRGKHLGKLVIGANESTTLYLLQHIREFRRKYPGITVEVRRSRSSRLPAEVVRGDLELGAISYEPVDYRLGGLVVYVDRLCFVVSPRHALARRRSVRIEELGREIFVAHNVASPYRRTVLQTFQKFQVPLRMELEMPTVETIRRMVQDNEGVAFLPRMCVQQDLEQGKLKEVRVRELRLDRNIRLIYPTKRQLSYATQAFLELLRAARPEASGPAAES